LNRGGRTLKQQMAGKKTHGEKRQKEKREKEKRFAQKTRIEPRDPFL